MMDGDIKKDMFGVIVILLYGKIISALTTWLDFIQRQAEHACMQSHFGVAESVVNLAAFPSELNGEYSGH